MNWDRFKKWYYIVPAAIVATPVAIAIVVLVFGGIVMWLWNWLLPPLFGWPELGLLQAFGLLVLCRILFGGFGSGGGGGGGGHSRRMTPEERERLRRRMCRAPKEDQPPSAAAEQ